MNTSRLLLALAAFFIFAGCVGATGSGSVIVALLTLSLSLGVAACSSPAESGSVDTTVEAECDDGNGAWERCCTPEGILTQCCCPDGMACNYGQGVIDCGDGTCVMEFELPAGQTAADYCDPEGNTTDSAGDSPTDPNEPDAGPPGPVDSCDGAWESCCVDGIVDQCCCPEGAICNYGMFTDCGDGTCGFGGPEDGVCTDADAESTEPEADTMGPQADAETAEPETDLGPAPIDAGPESEVSEPDTLVEGCDGSWEACCVDGLVDQCCCPDGMACNYGQGWTDCGDGTCAPGLEMTPAGENPCKEKPTDADAGPSDPEVDAQTEPDVGPEPVDAGPAPDAEEPSCDGQWNACCVDGVIDQCCCPEGAICNFWFMDCGDGTCVWPEESCEPPEPPSCDGNWQKCCIDGKVDQCCCPEGVACNYGMFMDCGDGTCTSGIPGDEMCPGAE